LGRRRILIIAAVALFLLLIVYPAALFATAWNSLGQTDALGGNLKHPSTASGTTYLVVGSDSRENLTAEERARLGTGKVAGRRTDTIMLLHVPSSGPTVLISVPRDSYVAIPGHGKNKINAAFAFGGPQLLVQTLEQATGIRIDGYVETGLGGYSALVDAIGGVNVCVKRDMNDPKAHINLKAGCQDMDGPTALGYARARYSDPLGDLGRVERQRQVLSAIAGKTLSASVILLPWRAFGAASAGGSALTADSGMSPFGLGQFILAMRSVAGGSGLSLTVPIGNPQLQTPAGEAVEWDKTKAPKLFQAIQRDDIATVQSLTKK
jgi:LCP family protein required for cell wall assembly